MDSQESGVKSYDLYVLAPDGRIIVHWEKVESESDDAAIKAARAITSQTPCELWLDERLVKRWD
jgi:hypothetical protein